MAPAIEKWAEEVRAGDVRALSRAITAIENHDTNAEPLLRALFPHTGDAYLIGVTGAPGTGKRPRSDAGTRRCRRCVHSLDGYAGIFGRPGTYDFGGGVAY